MIIYIADYIEPNRKIIPGLEEIRGIVFQDIDRAVYLSAKNTVRYLNDGGKAVDPTTVSTCEYSVSYTHLTLPTKLEV